MRFWMLYLGIVVLAVLISDVGSGQTIPPNVYLPIVGRTDATPTFTSTFTPTPTETPTVTSTATLIPTPTATRGAINCVRGKVAVLDTYPTKITDAKVLGEVCNDTDDFLSNTFVDVTTYNQMDAILDESYSGLPFLAHPRQRYCFWNSAFSSSESSHYRLRLGYHTFLKSKGWSLLKLSEVKFVRNGDTSEFYTTVTNRGPRGVFVHLAVSLYDADKRLLDCATALSYDEIMQGESVTLVAISSASPVSYHAAAGSMQYLD